MNDKKFSVTRDFRKTTLSVEDDSNKHTQDKAMDNVVLQNEESLIAQNIGRREALKNIAPSVVNSLRDVLRDLKLNFHKVVDKIDQK
jgi:hypothetical protein